MQFIIGANEIIQFPGIGDFLDSMGLQPEPELTVTGIDEIHFIDWNHSTHHGSHCCSPVDMGQNDIGYAEMLEGSVGLQV